MEVRRSVSSGGGERDGVGDIFSDESSFYGDAEMKCELERRVRAYDPQEYWDIVQWNIQSQAAQAAPCQPQGTKRNRRESSDTDPIAVNKKRSSLIVPQTNDNSVLDLSRPYNPYEGEYSAKQLAETVDDFLSRLRPSATSIADAGPWIRVANPYSDYRPTNQDVARFKQEGAKALADHLSHKFELEQRHPHKEPGSITRMLKTDREILEAYIKELATRCGVTCGKWMLFPSPNEVDVVWAAVCKAVVDGQLGCSAKVATNDGDPGNRSRLICIYTHDFSDVNDVKRVLEGIERLGLTRTVQEKARPIYYKSDAYTYLDISSGNEYKMKASMYCSNTLSSEISA